MAFTIQDINDLARLLVEHPEWRLELRRLLLSEELLTLPQAIRELIDAQKRAEERLEQLEIIVQNLAEQVRALVEQMRVLAEAQQRTTDILQRTTDTLQRMTDVVGGLKGRVLELTYRDKAPAYLGHVLRRLRVVSPNTLEDTLEAALTPGEFRDLFRLDLLLSGHPRQKPEIDEVWLAVELSSVVDQDDVDRAERRAGLLRKAGYRALPMAAGEQMTRGAEESARMQHVVLLQDGQVLFWEEALEAWVT
ncbi:MAG: hypothetical protein HY731_08120 [Candidatus Tectomicrobia bacterium]|nr:hypothetical protein [Candidatus Tectomicrobia bacterium]